MVGEVERHQQTDRQTDRKLAIEEPVRRGNFMRIEG